jgi:hypothetical protein
MKNNESSLLPAPSTPLPNAAITLLNYAADWVTRNFDPADEQPMLPVLLRVDQDGTSREWRSPSFARRIKRRWNG